MGTQLRDLIEPTKKVVEMTSFGGKTVAIDALNYMYQFLASIRMPDGSPLKDNKGRVTSHLVGFLSRTVNLLENGIKPIYVFDGKPNPLKRKELDRRNEQRLAMSNKMNDSVDDNDDKRSKIYAQGTSKVNKEMIDDAKHLLDLLGVPVVTAQEDGEAQASALIRDGKAWACVSQDYDAFLYGADRIVRNLSSSGSKKVGGRVVYVDIEFYKLETVLQHLDITREQLIDIAILVGVDFFDGIKGIGDKTALKIIKEYGDIENFVAKNTTYPDDVLKPLKDDTYKIAREIFLRPNLSTDYSVQFKKPNFHEIESFLIKEHNFSEDRVKSYTNRIDVASKRNTQVRLDSFLKPR